MLEDIIRALAKTHAFALVGASQGANAVLNAATEQPNLCNFLIVTKPFTQAMSKYSALLQPLLMCAALTLLVVRNFRRKPLLAFVETD